VINVIFGHQETGGGFHYFNIIGCYRNSLHIAGIMFFKEKAKGIGSLNKWAGGVNDLPSWSLLLIM
jgi:hypothetical protein